MRIFKVGVDVDFFECSWFGFVEWCCVVLKFELGFWWFVGNWVGDFLVDLWLFLCMVVVVSFLVGMVWFWYILFCWWLGSCIGCICGGFVVLSD